MFAVVVSLTFRLFDSHLAGRLLGCSFIEMLSRGDLPLHGLELLGDVETLLMLSGSPGSLLIVMQLLVVLVLSVVATNLEVVIVVEIIVVHPRDGCAGFSIGCRVKKGRLT